MSKARRLGRDEMVAEKLALIGVINLGVGGVFLLVALIVDVVGEMWK